MPVASPPPPNSAPNGRHILRRGPTLVAWALILAVLWVILAGADPGSWIVGVPTVAFALWARSRLSAAGLRGLSPLGTLRFLPYFLWESLKGGFDVALRVLGPRVRVSPGYLAYRLGLTRPSARVLFMNVVNLLPGTLTADIQGDRALIHVLDCGSDPLKSLRALEERVAALFGDPLAAPPPAGT